MPSSKIDLRQDFMARVQATIGVERWYAEFEPIFREVVALNPYLLPQVDGVYIAKLSNGFTVFYKITDDSQIRPSAIVHA